MNIFPAVPVPDEIVPNIYCTPCVPDVGQKVQTIKCRGVRAKYRNCQAKADHCGGGEFNLKHYEKHTHNIFTNCRAFPGIH
jgi:hypothetical protein